MAIDTVHQKYLDEAMQYLERHTPRYKLRQDYVEGVHRDIFASQMLKSKYGSIARSMQMNVVPATVAAISNNVQLESHDEKASELDVQMWDKAVLSAFETVALGDSYLLTWVDDAGRDVVHSLTPYEVYPVYDGTGVMVAAVKTWTDGPSRYADVYTADARFSYYSTHSETGSAFQQYAWEEMEDSAVAHSYGRVPVYHLAFNPRFGSRFGSSLLDDIIPMQDAMNLAVQSLVAGTERYVLPIKFLTNYQADVMLDPVSGELKKQELRFDDLAKSIFAIEGEGTMGQLAPPDPSALDRLRESWVSAIAQIAGIPTSELAPSIGNVPSGAALRALAARRTSTVTRFIDTLKSRLQGVPSPVFAPVEPVDDTEKIQAAVQLHQIGVSLRESLRRIGYSDAAVDTIIQDRRAEDSAQTTAVVQSVLGRPE